MDASILDLRYKMKDVLKALDRRETVRILYHGRIKGEIIPSKSGDTLKTANHPMFGLATEDESRRPVEVVADMRRSRKLVV